MADKIRFEISERFLTVGQKLVKVKKGTLTSSAHPYPLYLIVYLFIGISSSTIHGPLKQCAAVKIQYGVRIDAPHSGSPLKYNMACHGHEWGIESFPSISLPVAECTSCPPKYLWPHSVKRIYRSYTSWQHGSSILTKEYNARCDKNYIKRELGSSLAALNGAKCLNVFNTDAGPAEARRLGGLQPPHF